jgi:hypothetical protein
MEDYRNRYLENHPWKFLFGTFRCLALIGMSMGCCYGAVWGAFEGKWDIGIFFLLAMMITDRALDKFMEIRERAMKESKE